MMEFTFGVLSYNSALYILENLYSIKYQVDNYANDIAVDLIISDDGSKDNTVQIINTWVKKYSQLFRSVKVLTSDSNQGTVKNYHRIIHEVTTPYFHIIAGDDMYAKANIFEIARALKPKLCITSFPISLNDEHELFLEKHRLVRNFAMYINEPLYKKEMVRAIIFGSNIHTPSTLFLREDYTKQIEDYVNKFQLYEDDPKWFYFSKHGFEYKYIFKPFVIYRYHSSSVAHSGNSQLSKFDIDRLRLVSDYYEDADCSIPLKIYLYFEKREIQKKYKISIYKIIRELDYLHKYFNIRNNPKYKDISQSLKYELTENRALYRSIVEQTESEK